MCKFLNNFCYMLRFFIFSLYKISSFFSFFFSFLVLSDIQMGITCSFLILHLCPEVYDWSQCSELILKVCNFMRMLLEVCIIYCMTCRSPALIVPLTSFCAGIADRQRWDIKLLPLFDNLIGHGIIIYSFVVSNTRD